MTKLDVSEFFLIFLNCRRGMLELDILLFNFLEYRYYDLSLNLRNDLYILLLESDSDLYSWLVKKGIFYNIKHFNIIHEINKTNDMFDFC